MWYEVKLRTFSDLYVKGKHWIGGWMKLRAVMYKAAERTFQIFWRESKPIVS
jgi:hypothetical protein